MCLLIALIYGQELLHQQSSDNPAIYSYKISIFSILILKILAFYWKKSYKNKALL